MKKPVTFLICIITCLALFSSCNIFEHGHTMSDWKYNETEHWREPVCGRNDCIIQAEVHDLGEHTDEDENELCDVCGYKTTQYTTSIQGIDGATKIEVTKFDVGEVIGTVVLVEETSIKHIIDNLSSLKLKKLTYNEPTAIEYELIFYNANGGTMRTISITLDGWVDYGSLCSVVSGELDIGYIAGLFQFKGEQDLQFEIRDRAKEENLPCDDALEKFYEDESNEYYFSAIKSQYVVVIYNDGTSEDIVTALNAERVAMADLDKFGIEYYIEPKQ